MAADPPPPPRPGGLSLYANLLEPDGNAPASISRAPVVSQAAIDAAKEQEAAKKTVDSALRFQPLQQIRRPQQKSQKPKAFPKAPPLGANNAPNNAIARDAPAPPSNPPVKSSLADWAATEDDDYMYAAGEKRARGGRKKKKKKQEAAPIETDWDEIYDPARPTNVDEYLRSDERIREVQEWKAILYKHRRHEREKDSWDSDDDEEDVPKQTNNQFAPPPSYSFAPPPPSPPRAGHPADNTGDDAYARRIAMSQDQAPPPPPRSASPPPPPPPEPDSTTIVREPVRYAPPQPLPQPTGEEMDVDEDDAGAQLVPPEIATKDSESGSGPRENRPGKKGFAKRLMTKYGWSKGQGLGAQGTGIVQPIRVEVEKRKKKADADGGGWATPGSMGKIVGAKNAAGTSSSTNESASKFGRMSNVIVLRNMLSGMEDLQTEMENGLGQEIGEECGDKYGRVERLYIDVEGRNVYIKFTDSVSALRAVNALDGRIFAGNAIAPQYYDAEKFEQRIYE
ncbi:hypothetical protein F5Y18DRAFT_1057 [Xylariaceae sp. FL1019]|nr:hypothetical protein F5Y18DRAFT_1057 [Xylariaceae sp. FL1019]